MKKENPFSIVMDAYEWEVEELPTKAEAILENNLIQQLVGLGYAPVRKFPLLRGDKGVCICYA
jgi:hypothetical protein